MRLTEGESKVYGELAKPTYHDVIHRWVALDKITPHSSRAGSVRRMTHDVYDRSGVL